MKSLLRQITDLVGTAIQQAFGPDFADVNPQVRATGDVKFGDYQSNVAMGLAKRLGKKPREIADSIAAAIDETSAGLLAPVEVAGPGFINLRLRDEAIAGMLERIPAAPVIAEKDRLGIETCDAASVETVVVDYSSPNVAKEMHVGHLRSTAIGDVIARTIAFQGHRVIRQNHLGDWGTQFGKIILALWHLCMGRHQAEDHRDFDRLADELNKSSDAEKQRILAARCTIHQQNLDRDPDGREFHDYIQTLDPSFEMLLPAYRYVNAIEDAAEGTSYAVRDPLTGVPTALSSLSRLIAAMLQGKTDRDNTQELEAWRRAKEATLKECSEIYRRMGVLLGDDDVCGESFYEPLLSHVVHEVINELITYREAPDGLRVVCRRDKGAVCVFHEKPDGSPAFKGPQGDALPMIIQKSDGASLYATTDLAAALYRVAHPQRHPVRLQTRQLADLLNRAPFNGGLGADRVIYVVGAPQKLHFEMFFPAVHALGWTKKPDGTRSRLEHVAFGSVLGDDRKMLRTRSGDSVRLRDLLQEAVERAEVMMRESERNAERKRGLSEDEIKSIAETVGIAAVKYADLCQNRNTDYVFNWDKMLALTGNTAPYMLYAYARIRSIHRKGSEEGSFDVDTATASIRLEHPAERSLAMTIRRLPDTIDSVAESLMPNYLCEYLFDLAQKFMVFYEYCPVLKAESAEVQASRLRLCDLTARALRLGLGLLGIPTLERM